ncbi:uncharacterized protein UDID_14479 [Ustilago sp. UG-2017a]|nr:uncharacterized protein UDID_14479 [Ustilago sp. UG-2017a]
MLGQKKTTCLVRRALCIMAFSPPILLALAGRPLPVIPEDSTLPVKGAESSDNKGSGAALSDLHPPSLITSPNPLTAPAAQMAETSSAETRRRYVRLQRVPTTGLVRGQKGKLVPFHIKHPLSFFPDPDAAQKFPDPLERHDVDPSARITYEAGPPSSSEIGKQYHAIRLLGNGLDGQVLELKKKEGVPFYALSTRGKVWFFDTRDEKHFSYTDKVSASDREHVSRYFEPVSTAEARTSNGPEAETSDGAELEISDFTDSETSDSASSASLGAARVPPVVGRAVVKQSQTRIPWFQKLAKGAKSFFKKPFAFVKTRVREV